MVCSVKCVKLHLAALLDLHTNVSVEIRYLPWWTLLVADLNDGILDHGQIWRVGRTSFNRVGISRTHIEEQQKYSEMEHNVTLLSTDLNMGCHFKQLIESTWNIFIIFYSILIWLLLICLQLVYFISFISKLTKNRN